MKVGDQVIANVAENLLQPQNVQGVIISIYIAPQKNFYLIFLETGEYKTLEEKYVSSLDEE